MSWKFSVLNYFLGSTPEDEAPEEGASFTFMVPKKEISMVPDMGKWKRSQVGSSLWACARVFFESCLSYWTWYNHRLWRKSVAVSRFWRLSAVTWWNWWQRWCCRGHSTRNRLLIVLVATRLPLLPVICEEDVICNKLVSKYSVIFPVLVASLVTLPALRAQALATQTKPSHKSWYRRKRSQNWKQRSFPRVFEEKSSSWKISAAVAIC